MRKHLSAEGLLAIARNSFAKIADNSPAKERNREKVIPLVDCLMSGLAIFDLKMPSLFQQHHITIV